MESSLTKSEMDAVLQLIQLRSDSAGDFQLFWVKFPWGKEEVRDGIRGEEIPVETPGNSPEEALPRRRKKLRPILDIYRETRPFVKSSRALKRPKI